MFRRPDEKLKEPSSSTFELTEKRYAYNPFCEMGWKSLGLLELTALPSIKQELWVSLLQETDALLVGGGDCQYLTYWMQQSGLANLLSSLWHKMVYVGLSAGSMIMTRYAIRPNIPGPIKRWF